MHRTRKPFAGVLLALLLLVAVQPAGAGPLQVTPTEIHLNVDFPIVALEPGSISESFVFLDFCYGRGGFNPLQGEFAFTLHLVEEPDWLEVRVSGSDTASSTPPLGPTLNQETVCESSSVVWHLRLFVDEEAPAGAQGTVTVLVTVDEAGDVGTYKRPKDATGSASASVYQ